MIITEPGLQWQRVRADRGPRGEVCTTYACAEHPRLTRVVQRANADASYIETYHVTGLANHWHTPGQALEALRSNPA